MLFLIVIVCIIMAIVEAFLYWRKLRLSSEIEKNILKDGEYCDDCDVDYYMCSYCGCHKETQRDADVCAAWDYIFGKHRHEHTYPHDHKEEE